MSFKHLVDVYCSLFRHVTADEARFAEIDAFRRQLLKIEQDRNVYVHSIWATGDHPDVSMRLKATARAKVGLRVDVENMDAKEVQKVADEVQALIGRAIQIIAQFIPVPAKRNDESHRPVLDP